MNLNKKGYMLVEVIVSFTLAFAMLYFLMEIVINIKNISEDYYADAKLETDQILINKVIEDDIVKLGLKSVNLEEDTENLKIVNLGFNNNINKKLTIKKENNKTIFMYGKFINGQYDENELLVKTLDNRLDIGNVQVEVSCYKDEACSDTDKNKMLKIKIPATSIYSNNEYGVNLDVIYSYDEIKILKNIKAKFLHDDNISSLGYTDISCATESDSCEVEFPSVELKRGYKFIEWRDNSGNTIDLTNNKYAININDTNEFRAYSQAESITYTVYFQQTDGTTSSIICNTDAITNKCSDKITPSIVVARGYVVDGWYTNGGIKFKDENQNFEITGNARYYARTKVDPCGSVTTIKYTCSSSANCSLSNSNKILNIKGNTNLDIISDTQCSNKKISIALVGGGSGGNKGEASGYNGGSGGDGGYVLQDNNFTMNFSTTYSITIGAGGTNNQAGGVTTIKKGSDTVLSSANGEQIKYNTCTRSCYKTITFDGVNYGNYGAPGTVGKKGGYYEGYYADKPSDGANGSDNTGNGGNGGDGNVSGLIRKCGTGNCNSSNNIHYSYPAGNGGSGGSGIIVLYNKDGWIKQ